MEKICLLGPGCSIIIGKTMSLIGQQGGPRGRVGKAAVFQRS